MSERWGEWCERGGGDASPVASATWRCERPSGECAPHQSRAAQHVHHDTGRAVDFLVAPVASLRDAHRVVGEGRQRRDGRSVVATAEDPMELAHLDSARAITIPRAEERRGRAPSRQAEQLHPGHELWRGRLGGAAMASFGKDTTKQPMRGWQHAMPTRGPRSVRDAHTRRRSCLHAARARCPGSQPPPLRLLRGAHHAACPGSYTARWATPCITGCAPEHAPRSLLAVPSPHLLR